MKVKYIGPSAGGVELEGKHVPQGGEVDVREKVAYGLLEQKNNWAKAREPKAKAAPANTKREG